MTDSTVCVVSDSVLKNSVLPVLMSGIYLLLSMCGKFWWMPGIVNFAMWGHSEFLYLYIPFSLFWNAAKLLGHDLILLGLPFTCC